MTTSNPLPVVERCETCGAVWIKQWKLHGEEKRLFDRCMVETHPQAPPTPAFRYHHDKE